MPSAVTQLIRSAFSTLGIGVTRQSTLDELRVAARHGHDMQFLLALPHEHRAAILEALPMSRGQLRQDLFALSEHGFKRGGYFVEFGAASGVELSNTHLLETQFGWTGILAEPGRNWHQALAANRSCRIEFDCVWTTTGETLTFNESKAGEFSTLDRFRGEGKHLLNRQSGQRYDVSTISLNDLLVRHGAPANIDYLSIDTEGSEYDILSHVDFDRFMFGVVTCEHNFTANRQRIHDLLSGHGYVRKLEHLSRFDDWYVAGEALKRERGC
ncbi:FkbM family methyltransferase [Emcibacter sp. SYSU 3D8]|uniref:FkbM family methyltransferase n=1 Tax=Emcibacter sp. SYSU 3D8 TaxID=3133969 RepID=UPI0031FE4707